MFRLPARSRIQSSLSEAVYPLSDVSWFYAVPEANTRIFSSSLALADSLFTSSIIQHHVTLVTGSQEL
jgi:hypothetical protein